MGLSYGSTMYTEVKSHHQLIKKQILLLGFIFVLAVWLLFQVDLSAPHLLLTPHYPRQPELLSGRRSAGFLVNTEGCRIQDLDPFDTKILPFLDAEEEPKCDKFKLGRLVKADAQSIYVNWSLLEKDVEIRSPQDAVCKYCEFWRVEHPYQENKTYPSSVDTAYRFSSDCKKLENRTFIENEEFIQVECTHNGNKIFSDFFAFPKLAVNKTEISRREDKVNVLLIGIDAVSRLNLHRQMPKTVSFLKNKVHSIELLGYNKIGDNTFPNLVAVLSGLTIEELTNACWQYTDDIFDYCPMIWKKFKNAGYHTGFAEDSANIGLFNYQKLGFRKQPTDFYGQIFSLVSEGSLGSDNRLNTNLCVGNRKTSDVLLETARNFIIRLRDVLTWGIFWSTSLSHDYLNLPRYGDQSYVDFMEELLSEGIFNTSVIVFLSDHGIRWGEIRETYQGYMEERLPFVFMTFPEWFTEKYNLAIRNLKTNRRRLTTPFDLYETLLDLVDLGNIKNSVIKLRTQALKTNVDRGISMFLPVPENRTCEDAGITDNWCTCHTSKPVSTDNLIVSRAAVLLVDHLNELLEGYAQCSKLSLHKIHSARVDEVSLDGDSKNNDFNVKDKLTDYYIVVETVPGHGIFEATVRYNFVDNSSFNATVIDPVSRLNTYGAQSKCISHYALKLYCFCKWST